MSVAGTRGGGGLGERALKEVRDRHDFFVAWFNGHAGDAAFEATQRAFAPDMVYIDPDAATSTRDRLIATLAAARGKHASFAIEVLDERVLWETADAALVLYVERQPGAAGVTDRRSTALFLADTNAPNGVVWKHVHETWIAGATGPAAAQTPSPSPPGDPA